MLNHPAKLVVMFPMYEAKDYRRRLAALDDTLVVHVTPDGRFLFHPRPLRKLGPRSYAGALVAIADDLAAGHTLALPDPSAFLADLETLACEHGASKDQPAVEQAAHTIAARTRYQVVDVLDGDLEHSIGRCLISQTERRTRADRRETNGLSCQLGVPTPRTELLWHSLRSEWCDVRTAQHAQVAWQCWARRNRPDMMVRDAGQAAQPRM